MTATPEARKERIVKIMNDLIDAVAPLYGVRMPYDPRWEDVRAVGTGPHTRFPSGSAERLSLGAAAHSASAEAVDSLTWRHLLAERFYATVAEANPTNVRRELMNLVITSIEMMQDLDRRIEERS